MPQATGTFGAIRVPIVDKDGHPTRDLTKKLQTWDAQLQSVINIVGQINKNAVIQGRTEGIGTTVTNVMSDGTFNSLDNVHNGISYQRQPLFAGTAITVENGNFETSANLPPEGWTLQGSPMLSYDTVTPQSGLRSLIVTPKAQFDGILSTRFWSCNPGDAFRVGGWVMQSSAGDAGITLNFYDKTATQIQVLKATTSTTGAWTQVSTTGTAPANSVYLRISAAQQNAATRVVEFDNIAASRLQTAFELTPINTAGTPTTTSGLCSQSGVSTLINVAGSTMQFGSGTVAYNSGSIDPGSLGLWYVYADDPAYAGGAVTYAATATPSVCNAGNGRILFGKITTTGGGGATSTGGGTGGGGPVGKAALQ